MLSRRELIRAGTLGGLVVVAPGVFAACSDDDSSSPRGDVAAGDIKLVSSHVSRAAADPAAIAAGTASVVALGGGLYGQLVGSENMAISPFSAAVALGMSANGAVGRTLEEMLDVLSAKDLAFLDDGLNALTAYVGSLAGPVPDTKSDVIALDSANQLFGQTGEKWQQPFLDALARSYGAGLREVDFEKETEKARVAVNDWTAGRTHGRIPEIIPQGVLDEYTRMVLVNALYFKAPWLQPFDAGATTDDDFHLADGTAVKVPTMHGGAQISDGDGWRSARIAYSGFTLAMTVVLPDEGREDDLDALIRGGGLPGLLATSAGDAELSLPRWKFLAGAPLSPALKALGMPTALDSGVADFSGMTTEEELYIAAVLQQVFIAVDEAGTEAAAATAVVMSAQSGVVNPPQPLVVDRPFVFVIHDLEHGTPLFLGKVLDPRADGG